MPESFDNIKTLAELTDDDLYVGIVMNNRLVPIFKREPILNGKFLLELPSHGGYTIRTTRDGDTECVVLNAETYLLLTDGKPR